jgi:hypothetical protein
MRAIDAVLSDKEHSDAEMLSAVLLCECRILYLNVDICEWVVDSFKVYFAETHSELKARTQH